MAVYVFVTNVFKDRLQLNLILFSFLASSNNSFNLFITSTEEMSACARGLLCEAMKSTGIY